MRLQEIAGTAGATDLFALRKLSDLCYFNVGGVGRGEGWAGNLALDPAAEPMLDRAAASGFEFTRGSHLRRIFGPYWAVAAALVSDGGSIVVFGGDHLTTDQSVLTELAGQTMATVGDVPPTKLEADEAEIDQARQSVAAIPGRGDGADLGELARRAAMALGCEFGAVLSRDNQISTADLGWRPAAEDSELIAALFPLRRVSADSFHIEQDAAACRHAVRPLGSEDGVVSFAAASIGEGGRLGTLVVAHTGSRPRGFTDLCQKVLKTIVEEAGVVFGSQVSP